MIYKFIVRFISGAGTVGKYKTKAEAEARCKQINDARGSIRAEVIDKTNKTK